MKRSQTELSLEIEDSTKFIHFFVGAPDSTGSIVPVEDVEARIYVKRLFGLLPVSEDFETTNEEGILTIQFPDDIPGDENGTLNIIAKVTDHDEFGNLIHSKEINWGVPLKVNDKVMSRELWSPSTSAGLTVNPFTLYQKSSGAAEGSSPATVAVSL